MSDPGTALVVSEIAEMRALSKEIALSQLLPQALRQKPADVMAIILTGRELGLAPMQAIRGIHIISGKASLSADLMGALVKRSPTCEYLILAESSGTVATYKTKRRGEPGESTLSFTIAQAQAAGLNGDNWKKYPDAMLRARALAAICRAVYPDLCLGLYDSDSAELTPDTPETTQRQHVDTVKAQIREALKSDAVEGTMVAESSPTFAERIHNAATTAELKALIPELNALSPENQAPLKHLFTARKAALVSLDLIARGVK